MKIRANKIPKIYLIAIYILSGLFIYWGIMQLMSLLSQIALVLTQIFNLNIYIYLIIGFIFEGAILAGLIILIIKVIRLKKEKLIESSSEFELNNSNLKKIGIGVLIITVLNILFTFITKDNFDSDIATYVEKNLDTIDYELAYLQIASGLISFVRKALIFILYFSIISKRIDNKDTKANT
jgi:hypothetical protein